MGRALIIGGGIVGAACADAAARAGWHTLIVEPGPLGAGATAAGMGHLVVMDDSPAQLALTARSVELWREVSSELPVRADHRTCGTLWVAADEAELTAVQGKLDAYRSIGVDAELVDAARLSQLEPSLRDGFAGGLRVAGDAVVYAPVAAEYLAARANAEVIRDRAVELTGRGVRLAGGEHVEGDLVILAAGAGARDLAPELPLRLRKGHLLITERAAQPVRHQLVELGYLKSAHGSDEDSVAFNVQPRPTGQLLIGSSRQFDRPDADVDWSILRRMLRRAVEYLPSLVDTQALRVWTGQRVASADHLPLVGPHPDRPNVYVACGHEGLGVTTALGTAELLLAHLGGCETQLRAADYAPNRPQGALHA